MLSICKELEMNLILFVLFLSVQMDILSKLSGAVTPLFTISSKIVCYNLIYIEQLTRLCK